jgi:hypothetical protein
MNPFEAEPFRALNYRSRWGRPVGLNFFNNSRLTAFDFTSEK